MMQEMMEHIRELEIALLQLQRSALIDTQTIMQLMIDKGICSVDDMVSTRSKIEQDSLDIWKIDKQIVEHGGQITQTPLSDSLSKKEDLKKELKNLISQLKNSENL